MAKSSIPAHLSCDHVQEAINYNPASGEMIWRVRPREHFPTQGSWKTWNARWAGKRVGTLNKIKGYYTTMLCGRRHTLHRLAWCLSYQAWPLHEIDHINGNRLDNRLENLRCVTRAENMRNISISTANTSGVTGVSWSKGSRKWIAYIKINSQHIHLGTYADFSEAVSARKAAAFSLGFSPRHGSDAPTQVMG